MVTFVGPFFFPVKDVLILISIIGILIDIGQQY